MVREIKEHTRQYNYVLLAENAYINDNKEKAIEFYKKALQFRGNMVDNIAILYNIAQIYDEINNIMKSLSTYEEIVKIAPNEAGAYYGMAMIYEQIGEKDKALEYYHKAIAIDPYYDRAYYYAANIFDEKGDKNKAIEYYYKVIEMVPNDYITYNNIGSIYEELGDYNKAYNMIEKSLDIEPDYYKALFNMGVVYKALGNNDKALEYYFKSININPKYSYSYLNISAIYIEQKRFQDTINLLTEGISNNKDAHDLYYNRACCYSILGNKKKALEDLKKAVILLPEIIESIKGDKDFENLYNEVEFVKIIEQ
ncbi:tetratricopeptide repeat protein [Tissierella praeacuta]|uniref:tetratricopeptide repeat protein n=1 Tax=Tissierella praeacuta TaxID=43131 RepID=UPI00333F6EEA